MFVCLLIVNNGTKGDFLNHQPFFEIHRNIELTSQDLYISFRFHPYR